jgi:hypothetical protein
MHTVSVMEIVSAGKVVLSAPVHSPSIRKESYLGPRITPTCGLGLNIGHLHNENFFA